MVLGVGLLDLFEAGLNLVIHKFFDLIDLGVFFGEHKICILFFSGGLEEFLVLFGDFEVEHFDFFYESDAVLIGLVFEGVELVDGVVVFLF